MRIEYDVKLDFRDVLIRPKRSVLKTRAEVSLEREFRFKHTKTTWQGVPIIAANMDHTGTFNMAQALAEHKLLTALDKFLTLEDWKVFAKANAAALPFCFVSVGIHDTELAKLDAVMKIAPLSFICLDVANGYTERFVSYLEHLREKHPKIVIM